MESNPDQLKQWLRAQGRASISTKGKEKDSINLFTALLEGDAVIAGETRPKRENQRAQVLENHDLDVVRHAAVEADMAMMWKNFVDVSVASLLSLAIVSATERFLPEIDYLSPSARGLACLVFGLAVPPIYLLILTLWRRQRTSFDWKMSWIVGAIYLLVFFILLAPVPHSEPHFWDLSVKRGWDHAIDTVLNISQRSAIAEGQKGEEPKKISLEDRQQGLQRLFAQNPDKPKDANIQSGDWWLEAANHGADNGFSIIRIILTILMVPVGLVLFISVNRQIKAMFQARSNPQIPSMYRMLGYVNVFAMPAIIVCLWSTSLPQWLEATGIIDSAERVINFRRAICILFAIQQLATVRAMVQAHLDMGQEITRIILSADKKTSGKGLTIQSHLRSLVTCVYVVAIELSALPIFQLALLASQHWLADVVYLTTLTVTWPVTILALLIPNQSIRSSA